MNSPRRWSTKDEVAEHLRCSTKTVDRLVDSGTITAYPIGPRMVRFDIEEIDQQMLAGTQETAQ